MKQDKDHIVEILLHSAQGFYDIGISAAAYLENAPDGNTFTQKLAPAAVNICFAAELLLKGLILISLKEAKSGHSLVNLFSHLPDELKKTLKAQYDTHQNIDKDKKNLGAIKMVVYKGKESLCVEDDENIILEKLLESHDRGFEKWRYNFEIEKEGLTFEIDFKSMNCLIKATIDTINSIPYKRKLVFLSGK